MENKGWFSGCNVPITLMPVETTPKSSPSGGTIKPDPVQALLMINTGLVQIVVTFFYRTVLYYQTI